MKHPPSPRNWGQGGCFSPEVAKCHFVFWETPGGGASPNPTLTAECVHVGKVQVDAGLLHIHKSGAARGEQNKESCEISMTHSSFGG